MRPYIFSFRIGGVVVRAEPSWLFLALLVGWSLASGFFPGLRDDFSLPAYIAMAVAGVAGLTFSIIAHELSHTFVGRAFGLLAGLPKRINQTITKSIGIGPKGIPR